MNIEVDISNVVLETERLILRPWTPGDVDDLYEYASVRGVGEWAGWLPHRDREESRRIVEMFMREKETFALEYRGKAVGSLSIQEYIEPDFPELECLRARELGFVLAKACWGRGLMTEAVKAALRYAFDTLELDAVTCCYYEKNARSARVQEKCGFRHLRDAVHETRFGELRNTRCNVLYRREYVAGM